METTGIKIDVTRALNFDKKEAQQEFEAKLQNLVLDNQPLLNSIHTEKTVLAEILETAAKLRNQADALLVLGVGGSQAGTKAVVDALKPTAMEVFFAGQGFSGYYLKGILDSLAKKSVAVVVISKSGDTAETLLTFGIVRKWLAARYGEAYKTRIVAITGKHKQGGSLGILCRQEGYQQVFIPDNVGGRYSLFTAVGLLPMAAAGVDIQEFLAGAIVGEAEYSSGFTMENSAVAYAIARNLLYQNGYGNELWVTYAPYLVSFGTWWRQLFVESESKNGNGIYPVVAEYSNDLHYLGQYLRQGPRNIFETVVWLETAPYIMAVDEETTALIGWQEAKNLAKISKMVKEQTSVAHFQAGVPQIEITLPCLDGWQLGKLVVLFVQACLISGYLQGCNPLDQPGVEEYKQQILKNLK